MSGTPHVLPTDIMGRDFPGLRQGYLWEPAKPDSNLTKYRSSKMAALSLRKTNYGAFFLIRNFGCLIFGFHQWRRFFYPSYYGHRNCLGKYGFRHLCWVVRCQALHVPEGTNKFDAIHTSRGNDVGNNAKGKKIVAKNGNRKHCNKKNITEKIIPKYGFCLL